MAARRGGGGIGARHQLGVSLIGVAAAYVVARRRRQMRHKCRRIGRGSSLGVARSHRASLVENKLGGISVASRRRHGGASAA